MCSLNAIIKMKNIAKLLSLLAISAFSVVSGQLLYPGQQIGNSSNCVADTFGNIGTCQRISECRGYRNSNQLNLCRNDDSETNSQIDPIVCCPPSSSRPLQEPDTIGQNGGNGQNGANGQNGKNEQNGGNVQIGENENEGNVQNGEIEQNGGNDQNGGNGQNEQYRDIQRPTISQKVSDQFSNPEEQFRRNSNCLADDFGNIGTCERIPECRGLEYFEQLSPCGNSRHSGSIVCCPVRSRGGGPIGGRPRGGGPRWGGPRRGGPRRGGPREGDSRREGLRRGDLRSGDLRRGDLRGGVLRREDLRRGDLRRGGPKDEGRQYEGPINTNSQIGDLSGAQNGRNGLNENIRKELVSERKCQQFYSSPPPEETGEIPIFPPVVGGKITEPDEFPFMAAIGWENTNETYDYNCGGFLVDHSFVVTAAHCTSSRGVPPSVVRLGGNNLDTSGSDVDIKISRIIHHPKYTDNQSYNDIALIELEDGVPTLPACLWPSYDINFQQGTAIGYGHTSFGGRRSSDLMKVNLTIFSNEECSQYYQPGAQIENSLDQSQLCAGDPNRAKDTCQGDSGGPILVDFQQQGQILPYVIGVTSFGQGCAGEAPSIYTRISSYTQWIESIVWPNESLKK